FVPPSAAPTTARLATQPAAPATPAPAPQVAAMPPAQAPAATGMRIPQPPPQPSETVSQEEQVAWGPVRDAEATFRQAQQQQPYNRKLLQKLQGDYYTALGKAKNEILVQRSKQYADAHKRYIDERTAYTEAMKLYPLTGDKDVDTQLRIEHPELQQPYARL